MKIASSALKVYHSTSLPAINLSALCCYNTVFRYKAYKNLEVIIMSHNHELGNYEKI